MNVTTGADPMITLHGTVAKRRSVAGRSVSVAVTSFWPRSKSTVGERRDAAGEGRVRVRVGRRAVGHLQHDAAGLGGERHRLRERRRRLVEAAAEVRGRLQRQHGRHGVDPDVDGDAGADADRVGGVGDAHAQLGRRRDGAVRVLDAVRATSRR